jgi:DNA-damage-inducible protein D
MTDITTIVQRTFEDIRMTDETGFEFWSARDLMGALGYSEWRKFSGVIQKAKIACENSIQMPANHFVPSDKMVTLWSGSQRTIEDYFLTRYACYLVAQNGDSRKTEISLAQTYFASQTRKLEIQEQRIDENKRIDARRKLAENEEKIEETVYARGISLPVEFATFKNKWIQALYTISVKWLKQKRWIPENRALADFDTEVELRAKDFIYAMTDHNIRENDIQWKNALEEELISSSHATRAALLRRGITPEDLTPQEDLKQIGKRRGKEEKYLDTGM